MSTISVEQLGGDPYCHLHLPVRATPQTSSWTSRSADTGLQAHRRDKLQAETGRPTNSKSTQMVKGKHKNVTNRNQGYLSSSEHISPTTASLGYPNTLGKERFGFKIVSHVADRGLWEEHK